MKIRKLIPKSVLIFSSLLFLTSCERCYELWPETDRQFGWAYDLPDSSMIRRNADTENKRYSISFHGGKKEDGSESFLNIGMSGTSSALWGIAYVKDGEATWILNKQDNNFTGGELLLDTGERIEGDYELYDGNVYISYKNCPEDIREKRNDSYHRYFYLDKVGSFSASGGQYRCEWNWKFWEKG